MNYKKAFLIILVVALLFLIIGGFWLILRFAKQRNAASTSVPTFVSNLVPSEAAKQIPQTNTPAATQKTTTDKKGASPLNPPGGEVTQSGSQITIGDRFYAPLVIFIDNQTGQELLAALKVTDYPQKLLYWAKNLSETGDAFVADKEEFNRVVNFCRLTPGVTTNLPLLFDDNEKRCYLGQWVILEHLGDLEP